MHSNSWWLEPAVIPKMGFWLKWNSSSRVQNSNVCLIRRGTITIGQPHVNWCCRRWSASWHWLLVLKLFRTSTNPTGVQQKKRFGLSLKKIPNGVEEKGSKSDRPAVSDLGNGKLHDGTDPGRKTDGRVTKRGKTVINLAVDGQVIGLIAIQMLRRPPPEAIKKLKEQGLESGILTGIMNRWPKLLLNRSELTPSFAMSLPKKLAPSKPAES